MLTLDHILVRQTLIELTNCDKKKYTHQYKNKGFEISLKKVDGLMDGWTDGHRDGWDSWMFQKWSASTCSFMSTNRKY